METKEATADIEKQEHNVLMQTHAEGTEEPGLRVRVGQKGQRTRYGRMTGYRNTREAGVRSTSAAASR